jgi:ferredoxin
MWPLGSRRQGASSEGRFVKVTVFPSKCEGYACCVISAPEVFDLDTSSGRVMLLLEEPDEQLRDLVEEAARDCPVRAISIDGA